MSLLEFHIKAWNILNHLIISCILIVLILTPSTIFTDISLGWCICCLFSFIVSFIGLKRDDYTFSLLSVSEMSKLIFATILVSQMRWSKVYLECLIIMYTYIIYALLSGFFIFYPSGKLLERYFIFKHKNIWLFCSILYVVMNFFIMLFLFITKIIIDFNINSLEYIWVFFHWIISYTLIIGAIYNFTSTFFFGFILISAKYITGIVYIVDPPFTNIKFFISLYTGMYTIIYMVLGVMVYRRSKCLL